MTVQSSGWVLVVDDDEDIRSTIQSLLMMKGFRVETAADGAAGLARLRQPHPPALVILDLMMPGMNGEEFRLTQLREPAVATIPVVMLSGAGRLSDKAALLGVEAVAKPIDLQLLFDTVSRFCAPDAAS